MASGPGIRTPQRWGYGFRVRGLTATPRNDTSDLHFRHIDPAPFLPALEAKLGELHALDALDQPVVPRRVSADVADEIFPLDLEAVFVNDVVRHFFPLVVEVHGLRHVRIPHRPRRVDAMLGPALGETRDRRTMRA